MSSLVGTLDLSAGLATIPGPVIAGLAYSGYGGVAPFLAAVAVNVVGLVVLLGFRER